MPLTESLINGMKKRERICKTLVEKVVALETYPYQLDEKDKFLLYHLKMILKSGSDNQREEGLAK